MKFLRQLFARNSQPVILAAPPNGDLCQVLAAQAIPPGSLLQVATGQNALLFNGSMRSTIYPSGQHLLDAQDLRGILDGGEANVLFLQTAPPVKRAWQTIFRAENNQPLVLSGHYTAALDDTRHFIAALLDGGKMPDNRHIDGWLHQYIRKILADQRVPARDIIEHTDRLAVFLHDALIPFLLDHGIRLQNFSLRLEDDTPPMPAPKAAPADIPQEQQHERPHEPQLIVPMPAAAVAAETPPPPASSQPDASPALMAMPSPVVADPLPEPIAQAPAPKIFYRLERGQQVGPYNVDDIRRLIEAGTIRRHDLLWHQGMKSWQKASEFSVFKW